MTTSGNARGDENGTDNGFAVDLRGHIEALFREKERAMGVADTEREKSASALRDSLARSIQEGDDRLREHILNQIQQLKATLVSGELLEVERINAVRNEMMALIDANTREFRQVQGATQQAVTKAEEAQQRVNLSQNEFRGSLADQASLLMPRKESESRHAETSRQVAEIREHISELRTDLAVGPSGLRPLESRAARDDGLRAQSRVFVAAAISVSAVVVAASGIIVAVFTH